MNQLLPDSNSNYVGVANAALNGMLLCYGMQSAAEWGGAALMKCTGAECRKGE